LAELQSTAAFLQTHMTGGGQFPWPEELFRKIVDECDGWFPVEIRALPEGSVVYPHVPLWTITAKGEFSGLVTFLETLLSISTWYPCTVATLSRRCRDVIEAAFAKSVDEDGQGLLDSRLHDFGFRGCASLEQAIHGGVAHLINFRGTDTLPAAYHAQYALNNGNPVASSIPASEHSVMLGYDCDSSALEAIIEKFGGGPYSVVLDTWDYKKALEEDLALVAEKAKEAGGTLVIRPDSGDPTEMVLIALEAANKVFGFHTNSKGYRVLKNSAVIFGDGLSYATLGVILNAVMFAGWSAQNVAFGMGSHLLHRVHRDTMSFAVKVSHSIDPTGRIHRDMAKVPKTEKAKFSIPGRFYVCHCGSHPIVYPEESHSKSCDNMLKLVYDYGRPINRKAESFDEMRDRVAYEWSYLPKLANVISPELQTKIAVYKPPQGKS